MADRVQAGVLKASLSNYVATAALAVLAGAVAVFSFVQQNYDPSIVFYLAFGGALVALVLSIILGGKGTGEIVTSIATGTWDSKRKGFFNSQAVLTLVGLSLVLAATWIGTTSPAHHTADPCVAVLSTDLSIPSPDTQQLRHDIATCRR